MNNVYSYLIAISAGVLLRAATSLHPYSGFNQPPMYGDFEAQRHWQEVMVHLPTKEWYQNSTKNDLMYWGLDYPPLTAYHSLVLGMIAGKLNSSYVELLKSHGITEPQHKLFMRNTVLVADILIYIPSLLLACITILKHVYKSKSSGIAIMFICIALLYPGQILIDNGHFQYNNISLGLTVLAIVALLKDKRILGAIFFVFALNYKQMELYHALPFFFYLLANCFKDADNCKVQTRRFSFFKGITRLISLGVSVLLAFSIIWLPWILEGPDSILQVIHRIFPIARGVFEDKVSNIWCVVNVFYKLRTHFSNEQMVKLCLSCTVATALPSSIRLLFKPTKLQFLYALFISSMAFFLFSFQVHEKSILIAAVPAILLFPLEPFMVFWFLQISTFSIFPLLLKDGLLYTFIATSGIYFTLTKFLLDFMNDKKKNQNFIQVLLNMGSKKPKTIWIERLAVAAFIISTIVEVGLILAYLLVQPPKNLPFLHPLLVSAFSCCHFMMFFAYFSVKQFIV